MKNNAFVLIMLHIFIISNISAFSFKSISSFFSSEKFEEVKQQEIPIDKHAHLTIKTIKGPVHIQTWQQPKILVKAIKRANKEEMLAEMSIDIKSNKNTIAIKTVYNNDAIKGSVEYQLLVPSTINISLKADTSPTKIEHISGMVTVNNENGNIELHAIDGPIDVEIGNKGSIIIEQPGNTIKAFTHSGTIDIFDAKKSIYASTDSGKIRTSCKMVPTGSTIKLDASSPIFLQLPTDTSATLQAETEQGAILCDHYVTIKPFITQLNAKAWNQFKRNINGNLGNGEAQICLHSVGGNIKITKETA